jgi:hypothetical protein
MSNIPSSKATRRLSLVIVLIVLSIYSFPYLATTAVLKSKQVPYSFAPDLSFYLNLSQIGSSSVNPYFGTIPQSAEFGYLTFDTVFRLLGFVVKIAGNDLWWAVLIWNLFWWTAMCVGALWLLRQAFPEEPELPLWLGMALLFFFNFGVVKSLLIAWLHLPSFSRFNELSLPYIRTVFPQVGLALLFFYLALQIRALESWRWCDWMGMCFLQAAAFAMFPYATLIMAGTTGVAVLADLAMQLRIKHLWMVVAYGTACALIDIAFLWSRLSRGGQHPRLALISLHPSRALDLAGGAFLLLALLTIATAIAPATGTRGTKWTLVGLGVANSLLMLGDTVFSPALLLSHHGGYFIHSTISLQIVYLAFVASVRFERRLMWLRATCLAIIVLATTNGFVVAYANYRHSLPENRKTNNLALAVRPLNLSKADLIIARAKSVDDPCSWIPLLTPTKVLFCRSAQYELSTEEKRTIYRERQAFYLYFMGRDSRGIERVATDSIDLAEQDRLAFAGEINTADKERSDQAKASIRTDLVPLLLQVEQSDGRMQSFFTPYKRVLIIDDATNPTFVRQRLSRYFSIESERSIDDIVFLWCRPL